MRAVLHGHVVSRVLAEVIAHSGRYAERRRAPLGITISSLVSRGSLDFNVSDFASPWTALRECVI